MNEKAYLSVFIISGVFFIAYNEFILLPYQVWDPSGYRTREEMLLRNPLINVFIILGSFGSMCVGSYAYVVYDELNVMAIAHGLTDLSAMKDTTKKEKWLK